MTILFVMCNLQPILFQMIKKKIVRFSITGRDCLRNSNVIFNYNRFILNLGIKLEEDVLVWLDQTLTLKLHDF